MLPQWNAWAFAISVNLLMLPTYLLADPAGDAPASGADPAAKALKGPLAWFFGWDNPPEKKSTCCENGVLVCADEKSNLENMRLFGDFLYFKPVEDSLAYAMRSPNSTTTLTQYTGDFIQPDWKYSPAFRLDLGVPVGFEGWGLDLSWTYFDQSNSTHETSSVYDLYTTMAQASPALSGNAFVNSVRGKWHLQLNNVELTLEKVIPLLKSFSIRPIFGVAYAVIDQSLSVNYQDYLIESPLAQSPQKIKGNNNTWGVGPKIALGMAFTMPLEFSFDFLVSFSGLFGKSSAKTTYSDFLNAGSSNTIGFKESGNRLFTMLQLQASLKRIWAWESVRFSLQAGWETQIWFRQLRLNYFGTLDAPSIGADLTLQGPFARAALEF
jgi:hypothetical protein